MPGRQLTCAVRGGGIPTVPFETSGGQLRLDEIHSIIVDSRYADSVNTQGESLIPPSLKEFAETFAQDLRGLNVNVSCSTGASAANGSVFLTLGDSGDYLDVAGRESAEGYSLTVSKSIVEIAGASALGAWWGTRSVLQQVSWAHHGSASQVADGVGSLEQRFNSDWHLQGHSGMGNQRNDAGRCPPLLSARFSDRNVRLHVILQAKHFSGPSE